MSVQELRSERPVLLLRPKPEGPAKVVSAKRLAWKLNPCTDLEVPSLLPEVPLPDEDPNGRHRRRPPGCWRRFAPSPTAPATRALTAIGQASTIRPPMFELTAGFTPLVSLRRLVAATNPAPTVKVMTSHPCQSKVRLMLARIRTARPLTATTTAIAPNAYSRRMLTTYGPQSVMRPTRTSPWRPLLAAFCEPTQRTGRPAAKRLISGRTASPPSPRGPGTCDRSGGVSPKVRRPRFRRRRERGART